MSWNYLHIYKDIDIANVIGKAIFGIIHTSIKKVIAEYKPKTVLNLTDHR